jgi:hypothetical protein
LKLCIHDPEHNAFLEGVDHEYWPAEDAFNVLSLLHLLEQDRGCKFQPFHPEFAYTKISRTVDKHDTFLANKSIASPISLVYHSSRANVSIGCVIHGHSLDENDSVHADQRYRAYAIVKDGIKNVSVLPVILTEPVFDVLSREQCIPAGTAYDKRTVYLLDITHLPVVNRKFVHDGEQSVQDFATATVRILMKKACVKYLKKRISAQAAEAAEEDDEKSSASSSYSRSKPDPSVVRDFYMAPELNVKIAKCSTLPPINDKLLAKLEGPESALTMTEAMMLPAHRLWVSGGTEAGKAELERLAAEVQAGTAALEQAKMAFLISRALVDKVNISVEVDERIYNVEMSITDAKVYMD